METIVMILLAGMAGGFVKSVLEQKGAILLPKIEDSGQDKYLHLGIIGNMIIGMVAAVLVATTPLMAFTAGLSGSFMAENIVEKAAVKTPAIPQ